MGVERKAGALLVAGADRSSVAREFSGYAADEGRGGPERARGADAVWLFRCAVKAARPASEKAMYSIVVGTIQVARSASSAASRCLAAPARGKRRGVSFPAS